MADKQFKYSLSGILLRNYPTELYFHILRYLFLNSIVLLCIIVLKGYIFSIVQSSKVKQEMLHFIRNEPLPYSELVILLG